MTMPGRARLLIGGAVALASPAQAQPVMIPDSGDTAWMLAASALTMFAVLPGLALVHGRGRAGPAGLALFVATSVVSILFVVIGYSLAFSGGTTLLGGTADLMLRALPDLVPDTTISGTTYALYELCAAVLAVGILVASVAERARVAWLAVVAGFWSLIVYVPVAHWIWGGGWLAQLGTLDFGGGIVIQTTAGIAALAVAILLGRGRDRDVAHDSRLAVAGTALSWIGWFGLVGGAAMGATDDAGAAIINVQLAASTAALVGLAIEALRTRTASIYGATTAAVAGLAAISAGAGFVGPGGAMAIGVAGAAGAALAATLARALRLGGAASGFVAHGGGGIAGALAFPLFILPALGGPGFDEGISLGAQMGAQAVGLAAVILWTAAMTTITALMVAAFLPMKQPSV